MDWMPAADSWLFPGEDGVIATEGMSHLAPCMLLCTNTINWIKVYVYIQCPPLILAPLINMSKGGCENKSALFILLIFHSINSQNSSLSLK